MTTLSESVSTGTLPLLVEEQVRRHPDGTAVICESTRLTYRELNARANRLARVLVAGGAGPEQVVALALPRSADMTVAILAVVKAGAAYLPVDPDYPAGRIAGMVAVAGPPIAVTTSVVADVLPGHVHAVVLDDPETAGLLDRQPDHDLTDADRAAPLHPDNAAYVIFTSGSTGGPKGVVVTHRGLGRLSADHIERFGIRPGDGVLQFASFSFDCSVGDVVMALTSGAAHIIRPAHCLAGEELGALIRATGATHMTIPPQVLAALPPGDYPTLRTLGCGGDTLRADLVSHWAPGRRMFNIYGPTESTVDSVVGRALPGDPVPPIGEPVLGTRAYVLDADAAPADEGELYLAGEGLARGYHSRPGLTAQRFLPCPFGAPGERMYRTGDLVRRRPDGQLEFRGRVDEQVKVRGFLVEPAEVESVLDRHPDVRASVVVAREDRPGAKQLVAYVVPETADPARLRDHLTRTLPEYLVPAAIVPLPSFPLSTNGKLDRTTLPAPATASGGREPVTPGERLLCELVADVLGLDRVGADDAFFELGGDSVLTIRLAARVRDAGWRLTPGDVFALQTAEALAPTLTAVDNGTRPDPGDRMPSDLSLLSLSQDEIDALTDDWGS